MEQSYLYGAAGGALIGLAASGMLFTLGRVMGVSGIFGGLLTPRKGETSWRLLFIVGMVLGALGAQAAGFSIMEIEVNRSLVAYVVGGLLVGTGTTLGSGCTSGHGVCGLSRFSQRSLVATLAYVFSGFAMVYLIDHLMGGF